jgi:hypothetical protein
MGYSCSFVAGQMQLAEPHQAETGFTSGRLLHTWLTTPMFALYQPASMLLSSWPSMRIEPDVGSYKRWSRATRVVCKHQLQRVAHKQGYQSSIPLALNNCALALLCATSTTLQNCHTAMMANKGLHLQTRQGNDNVSCQGCNSRQGSST